MPPLDDTGIPRAYSDRYSGSAEKASHFSHTEATVPSASRTARTCCQGTSSSSRWRKTGSGPGTLSTQPIVSPIPDTSGVPGHTEGVDVTFEPLRGNDLPLIATWLARPHVRRWWRQPSDPASVEEDFGPLVDGSDPTEGFIVHLDGRPIGYLQRGLVEDDPETQHAIGTSLGDAGGIGIDYFIGEPELVGRGIGAA